MQNKPVGRPPKKVTKQVAAKAPAARNAADDADDDRDANDNNAPNDVKVDAPNAPVGDVPSSVTWPKKMKRTPGGLWSVIVRVRVALLDLCDCMCLPLLEERRVGTALCAPRPLR